MWPPKSRQLMARLSALRKGAREVRDVIRFGARVFWGASPPLTIALLAIGSASGLFPVIQVWITKHLIDALTRTASLRGTWRLPSSSLAPLLPWGAALVGVMVLTNLIDAITPLLSAHLRERTSQNLERGVYQKALRLELAAFESPDYYDRLERARGGLAGLSAIPSDGM